MIGTRDRVRNLPADVDARQLGQHHVEQHQIGPHRVEDVHRLDPVAGHLDQEALAFQPDDQGLDEGLLVLDDEHGGRISHDWPPWNRSPGVDSPPDAAGKAQRERRALALPGLDPDVDHRGCRRRGGRWPGRGRCRRCRATGPGRPGRSARRCARGPGPGCRCRGRRPRSRPGSPTCTDRELDRRVVLGVLDGVVDQVVHGRDQLAAVARDDEVAGRLGDLEADPAMLGHRPQPLDRLGDDQVHRDRIPAGGLLGLDPRQVEQVLDDAAEPLGLGPHPAREPGDHRRVVLALERLGHQAQRADRGLQLVADVGDEVPADGLQPAPLGDVLDDRHRPQDGAVLGRAGRPGWSGCGEAARTARSSPPVSRRPGPPSAAGSGPARPAPRRGGHRRSWRPARCGRRPLPGASHTTTPWARWPNAATRRRPVVSASATR